MATEGGLEGAPLAPEPGYDEEGQASAASEDRQLSESTREVPEALRELERLLSEDPHAFEFFQAVRVLERLHRDREIVGGFSDPDDEVARFGVEPFISFPASQIQSLELRPDEPARLSVNFMGLIGPLGVLPYYYTLEVAERARAGDRALRDFFDIFQHRLVSLFYRAWERSRFAVAHERDESDWATEHLLDLVGLGLPAHQDRMAIRDFAFLFYAGLLGPQQRSAVALEQMIEDYFDVPATVEQFVGGWYPLSVHTQCAVGETSPSEELGRGAVVGDEIWDQQSRVRIRLGPLTREQYDRFLPTGEAYEELRTLTRFFSHDSFDFEIQLVLARDEVPGCVVGAEDGAATPLGWSTWLRTGEFHRHADETTLML